MSRRLRPVHRHLSADYHDLSIHYLAGKSARQASVTWALNIITLLYNMSFMDNLNASFAALSDPTRRAILARLARSEATVMELAQPFAMSQPAISRHLKVLEHAGLIVRRVEGTKRPCRLAAGGIDAVDQWLAMLRKALTRNYDRLDELLAGMKPPKGRGKT